MIEQMDVEKISEEEANTLWARVRAQEICFDDFNRDRPDVFAQRLASPQTVVFRVKDSALVTVESIIPRLGGVMHFFLWDSSVPETELALAGRQVVSYCLDTYELVRLTAAAPSFNKLALRIAGRVGFKYEGNLRKSWLYKGVYYDAFVYGLLKDEWRVM